MSRPSRRINVFFKCRAVKEQQQRGIAACLLGAVPKWQYTDQNL